MDEKIKNIFDRLSKSKFRSSFYLKDKDILYIEDKGIDKIRNHAYDFVTKRLADTSNVTDGKQTPMKGHPVFIAQHGRNRIMSDTDVKYVVDVIMTWIDKEYSNYKKNHLS